MQIHKIFLFAGFISSSLVAQVADTSKVRSFEWKVPTKGDYGFGEIDTYIEKHAEFFGNYKNEWECDYTYTWKCYAESKLYKWSKDHFIPVKNEELFGEKAPAVLKMINDSIYRFYKTSMVNECAECFTGIQPRSVESFDNLTLTVNEKGITFSYFADLGGACDACAFYGVSYSWNFIRPCLKESMVSPPRYCTPSGPKVNIRSGESVSSSVLFQLDQGNFFEIRSKGKQDKVNGKDGCWYEIVYEGKQGYIFSFYTLCKS